MTESKPTSLAGNNKLAFGLTIAAIVVAFGIGGVFAYNRVYTNQVESQPIVIDTTVKGADTSVKATTSSPVVAPKPVVATPTTCLDGACFARAIRSCSRAMYQAISKVSTFGSTVESELRFDLTQSGGSCQLTMQLIAFHVGSSTDAGNSAHGMEISGLSQDEAYLKLNKDMQEKYVGKKGVCTIAQDKEAFAGLFERNTQAYAFLDPDRRICSGDLFIEFGY
ncbi:MAG: hypothetical protein AAB365_02615 [Patescibacteria group bacterium]|mgnify:CR=1 FL=1